MEVIRSEERLALSTERVPTERLRLGKRVVTEKRTLTVTVRREEFFLEGVSLEGTTSSTDSSDSSGEAQRPAPELFEFVLHEEEIEITTRPVARERVRVHVDRVAGTTEVASPVAREVVEIDEGPAAR